MIIYNFVPIFHCSASEKKKPIWQCYIKVLGKNYFNLSSNCNRMLTCQYLKLRVQLNWKFGDTQDNFVLFLHTIIPILFQASCQFHTGAECLELPCSYLAKSSMLSATQNKTRHGQQQSEASPFRYEFYIIFLVGCFWGHLLS